MRLPSSHLTLLVLLAACSGDKEEADADGDGIESPLDCDDNDPAVLPGAVEVCDGVDNDCDGEIDEGTGDEYFVDADLDGYGDATQTVRMCEAQEGFVQDAGDCDDSDDAIHPGATESCDAVDRNCDGNPTNGATDFVDWFVDRDGDGYGANEENGGLELVTACEAPASNYVDNDGDCDDNDDQVNPDGAEVCNNVDDDCNGTIDDNASDATTVYTDADGDGFGADGSGMQGCATQGLVVVDGDCDDAERQIHPGRDEVCNGGIDDDCDPSTDEDVVDGDLYYIDGDGDGFGGATEVYACVEPTDGVDDGGDCNDGDDTIHPEADELCDGVDRNCDGDPNANAIDQTRWYRDGDGDGVAAANDYIDACDEPAGYPFVEGLDCDDADPLVTEFFWYVDADGDGYGDDAVSQISACEQPNNTSELPGDCDDAADDTFPGANELCDGGIDNDCDPATDEAFTAEWYEDADGDGFGDEGNVYYGCDPDSSGLVNPTQVGGDCDDANPNLNPVLTPVCILEHCGVVSGSEVWKSGVEHYITCDVEVEGPDKPRVTIEGGATVYFSPETAIRVGDGQAGSLQVDGDVESVLFTSVNAYPAEGDFEGLVLGEEAEASTITGLTIEYGGGGAGDLAAGLVIETEAAVEVHDSLFYRNSGDGLRVNLGRPLIYDSMFVFNENNGVYVEADQGLSRTDADGTPGPSFSGNLLNQNGARPISLPGSHADELDASTTLLDDPTTGGGNVIAEIELLTGTMRSTGTWAAHQDSLGALIPYYVAEDATIEVADGPQARLTVADGVRVTFDVDSALEIGVGDEGSLVVGDEGLGLSSDVTFTATQDMIDNNLNWDGITFGQEDGGSYVNGLTIEYGGGNGKGNLSVVNSSPVFVGVTSQFSDSSGIHVSGTSAAPSIQGSALLSNDEDGLYVTNNSGIARDVVPTFTGNTISDNGLASVRIPPNFVGELDDSTDFTGNGERVLVWGGAVLEAAEWQHLDEDYEFLGTVRIEGPQDPVVTVQPGTTIYMGRDVTFEVGWDDDGALVVEPDPTDPTAGDVLLTSADPVPGPGDWFGLYIGDNGNTYRQTHIDGMRVDYAGGSDTNEFGGAIELRPRSGRVAQRTVVLHDVEVDNSSKMGIYFRSSALPGADRAVVDLQDVDVGLVLTQYCFWAEPGTEIVNWTNVTCAAASTGGFGFTSIGPAKEGTTPDAPMEVLESDIYTDVYIAASVFPYVVEEGVEVYAPGSLAIRDGATVVFDDELAGDGVIGFEDGADVSIATALDVDGAFTHAGGSAVVDELSVGPDGTVDIQGGALLVAGDADVNGEVVNDASLTVQGETRVDGLLEVTSNGTTTLNGVLTLPGVVFVDGGTLTIADAATVQTAGGISVTNVGALECLDDLILNGTLTADASVLEISGVVDQGNLGLLSFSNGSEATFASVVEMDGAFTCDQSDADFGGGLGGGGDLVADTCTFAFAANTDLVASGSVVMDDTMLVASLSDWSGMFLDGASPAELTNVTVSDYDGSMSGAVVNDDSDGFISNLQVLPSGVCDYYDLNLLDASTCAATASCIIPNPFSGTICFP